jgi:Protein of unknown function (DUF1524)
VGKKLNLVLAVSVISLIGLLLPDQSPETFPTVSAPNPEPATSSEVAAADKVSESAPIAIKSPIAKPEPTTTAANNRTSLQELILELLVAAEVKDGYDRDLFRHWIDADGDGCNTRREVLIAEAKVKPSVFGDCDLTGGEWYSVYDQVTTNDPSDFDVDHFIPLKEAWDSGAYAWSSEKRKEFANDLGFGGSLIAVTASSNRSKSDRDPADWLPPNSGYHCRYITNWVKVKIRWGLTVDSAELATIKEFGNSCK